MDTFELAPLEAVFSEPFDIDTFDSELDMFHFDDSLIPVWCRPKLSKHELLPFQVNDEGKVELAIDARGFTPEELSWTIKGSDLVVSGTHTCDNKNKGCIEKRFLWQRTLPKTLDPDSMKAKLAGNEKLTIEGKRSPEHTEGIKIRRVPTGEKGKTLTNDASPTKIPEKSNLTPSEDQQFSDDVTVEVVPETESTS